LFGGFRLMMSSNSSAAAPADLRVWSLFKILSTKIAARRQFSRRLGAIDIRPPASTKSLNEYIAGNRFFAANSTMRFWMSNKDGTWQRNESVGALSQRRFECTVKIVGAPRFERLKLNS